MSSRVKEDVQKLFEFWCEVTKAESGNVLKQAGHIIESFPEGFKDEQIIGKIPEFAYPCEFENESVQTYSFVLTSDDSKWRFGFCRHDPKTQTAMVIITYLPWHDTFLRLLGVLGELRRKNNGEFELFLSEAYSKGVPEPGASLKLFFNAGENHFIFQRPSQFQLPSIPENHNLNLYYNFVDPKNMISVFAAMLSERRIIFTSRRLDKLSSCIQAANAFLYPMVWQHIFIPVLPMKLKDILSAPMPYLIGVPEAVLETMTPEELGEVVILNCDKKLFESPFDDVQEMPPDLVHQMKKSLSNPHDHIGDRVSRIFLIALVQLIGGYRDAVRFPYGQKIQWDQKAFIESRPPHLRSFLARMMELQIFQQFIEDRIQMLSSGLGLSDEFELETLKQAEKMNKRGRNYKEFLRNVKDKLLFRKIRKNQRYRTTEMTNPAVKSAVKSVKEGSRGVKTAYKDLKSKFRDVTPPKSQFHIQTSLGYNYSGTSGYHRSAPNSPVISRRQTTPDYNVINNHGGTLPIGTNEILFLTTSASNSYLENGYSTDHNIVNNNNLNLSPTISPSSSLCSSDMNLTQELQNHPLFKSPVVDRSSSQSLQTPTAETPIDLINLEDGSSSSNNTSFEIEDFDPLNQNAKPIPQLKLDIPTQSSPIRPVSIPTSIVIGSSRKSPIPQLNNIGKVIPTSTAAMSSSIPSYISNSMNKSTLCNTDSNSIAGCTIPPIHGPVLPYFTPQHNQHNRNQQGIAQILNNGINNVKNEGDDEIELLRKYGLDQFTLNKNGKNEVFGEKVLIKNSDILVNGIDNRDGSNSVANSINSWTTFD
ncbi:DENN domain-containing protein 1B isoform X4 [Condylostylus longicornis]|uniref:DENN domain-containing protein 1B isoform X4 n=1 Tax=Condylostylus longicornis TaxID=2530218 RepID=UPI00244DC664|nr:DENN domain-containing protein 1B isoform X4 [Condylostylus longicornis]